MMTAAQAEHYALQLRQPGASGFLSIASLPNRNPQEHYTGPKDENDLCLSCTIQGGCQPQSKSCPLVIHREAKKIKQRSLDDATYHAKKSGRKSKC